MTEPQPPRALPPGHPDRDRYITPGGDTWGPAARDDPRYDDTAVPMAAAGTKPRGKRIKRVRFRDLPEAEQNNRRVTHCVTYHWQRHGAKPTLDAIHRYTQVTHAEIARALLDPVVLANLRIEGVLTDEQDTYADHNGDLLMPSRQQMNAVDAILAQVDPDNNDTFNAALRSEGVSHKQWRGWMRDPVFASYVRDCSARLFGDHEAAMDVALLRQALGGNPAAIKLSLELTGRIGPTGGTTTDMMGMVSRILEILARRLDTATLALVADDLEQLTTTITGQQPALRAGRVEQVMDLTDQVTASTIVTGEGDDERIEIHRPSEHPVG